MLQQYWNMFVDFKIAEYYYQFYAISSSRRKKIVSTACTLASAACVVSWSQIGMFHLFWAAVIMISQVVSVLQPFFPYEKRLQSARYIHADLVHLCTEVEIKWNSFTTGTAADEIRNLITSYRVRFDEIEGRFADADTFPQNKRLHKQAENSAKQFFRRYSS